MPDQKYKPVFRQHRPRGWKVYERIGKPGQIYGFAHDQSDEGGEKKIICEFVHDNTTLFIYLHECGHVRCGHTRHERKTIPDWLAEYEADQYAINALREAGIPIPRRVLKEHKQFLRRAIAKSKDTVDDEDVLRYAYGRNWRRHR